MWDSLPAAQRVGRRWLAARPVDAYAMNQLSIAAARLGDTVSAQSWNRRLVAVNGMNRGFQLRLDLLAEEYDAVEQAVMPFLSSTGANDRGEGFWAYFMALRNQGRLREAMAFARDGWYPGLPPLGMKHEPSRIHQAIAFAGDGRWADRGESLCRRPGARRAFHVRQAATGPCMARGADWNVPGRCR